MDVLASQRITNAAVHALCRKSFRAFGQGLRGRFDHRRIGRGHRGTQRIHQSRDFMTLCRRQQITIGSILTELRQGDVIAVHSLRRGAAEAIEVIAHSDCRIAGKAIRELKLPAGATIGAIARPNEVIMGHDEVRIEPGDHVIVFVTDKREIPEIEKLFSRRRTIIEKITS